MGDDMRLEWDRRYAQPGYLYGLEPNVFVAGVLGGLPPGRLLLPGEGEGRNAVWAARRGWTVDAVDQSTVGRDKALALAARHGVAIRYDVADLARAAFTPGAYDAVAVAFVHLPSAVRAAVHGRLAAALRPGGTLVMEVFSKDQLPLSTGGPKNPDMLYVPDDLRRDFATLRIDSLESLRVMLDEGALHRGEAAVLRLVAVRAG